GTVRAALSRLEALADGVGQGGGEALAEAGAGPPRLAVEYFAALAEGHFQHPADQVADRRPVRVAQLAHGESLPVTLRTSPLVFSLLRPNGTDFTAPRWACRWANGRRRATSPTFHQRLSTPFPRAARPSFERVECGMEVRGAKQAARRRTAGASSGLARLRMAARRTTDAPRALPVRKSRAP